MQSTTCALERFAQTAPVALPFMSGGIEEGNFPSLRKNDNCDEPDSGNEEAQPSIEQLFGEAGGWDDSDEPEVENEDMKKKKKKQKKKKTKTQEKILHVQ